MQEVQSGCAKPNGIGCTADRQQPSDSLNNSNGGRELRHAHDVQEQPSPGSVPTQRSSAARGGGESPVTLRYTKKKKSYADKMALLDKMAREREKK